MTNSHQPIERRHIDVDSTASLHAPGSVDMTITVVCSNPNKNPKCEIQKVIAETVRGAAREQRVTDHLGYLDRLGWSADPQADRPLCPSCGGRQSTVKDKTVKRKQ